MTGAQSKIVEDQTGQPRVNTDEFDNSFLLINLSFWRVKSDKKHVTPNSVTDID